MTVVRPGDWAATLADLHREGFIYLDLLTAVDRLDSVEVVAHVVDLTTMSRETVSTRVAYGASIDSLTPRFAAANWHEREISEMFGIWFDGHPDPRPLLVHVAGGAPPLLKSTVLAARALATWPGATEGGRRSLRPAGVADGWLEPR